MIQIFTTSEYDQTHSDSDEILFWKTFMFKLSKRDLNLYSAKDLQRY